MSDGNLERLLGYLGLVPLVGSLIFFDVPTVASLLIFGGAYLIGQSDGRRRTRRTATGHRIAVDD